jgi:ribose transport system permease protein
MNQTKEGVAKPHPPPTHEKKGWSLGTIGVQGPLIGLVLLCIVFSISTDVFLTWRNWLNIIDQITVLGILAIGMTAVIIIAGIDLSVGSILAFSMMVMGWLFQTRGVPLPLAVVAGLLVGTGCGLVNGLLITRANLPPFIATLTMMSIGRGLANIITEGRQIVGFPDWFTRLSTVRHFGFLSVTVAVFIILALISWAVLRYTTLGRSLYAIGGSAEVARLAGIRVRKLTMSVYAFSGFLAGLASVALACRLNSSQPSAGTGYELDTIAAVVIGGASLNGGVGGIRGTIVGVLIIGVLRNGLNLSGVSPFVQQIVIGVVIALAVAADTIRRRD